MESKETPKSTVAGADNDTMISPTPAASNTATIKEQAQVFSRMRTELAYLTLVFGASATGVIGPVLVPGFSIIAEAFNINLSSVTLLNGSLVMALGVSAYICNALSTVIGTRLIYLLTTLLLVVTSCWGAAAQSYESLLAARVFQGLGMGSWFSVAGTTSITSMFAVHERGRRVGMWNFAVICSVNLAPVISAQVIVGLSWRWAFWLLAILFGLVLLMTVVALPETAAQAQTIESIDEVPANGAEEKQSPSLELGEHRIFNSISPPLSWKQALGINTLASASIEDAFLALISPLPLLLHPIVLWGCAMWSVTFTWTIIQGGVADQIWEAPPYNLSPIAVGNLVGIAPLIGSALGCILGGIMCDFAAHWMTKLKGREYEPEYRLLVIIPSTLAITIGSFGLGEAIERNYSAIVTAVFLAILNFGVGVGCTGIVAYTNDACQSRAGEVFGLAMVVKSAFAFGLSFMLNDYYANHGARVFFGTFGGLSVGVALMTVPMYVCGKRVRLWAGRRGLVEDV